MRIREFTAMITRVREAWTGRNDSGVTAVLVAMMMFLLMGFAAVAVDSGILFNDRRQQQSAADGGALAAVQFAKTTLPTTNCGALSGIDYAACRGAEEAIDVVEGTLPGRYALVGDWDTCVDAGKPAEFTQGSTLSDCISFTDNLQKVRVVLPGTDVDTSFARVIGVDTVRVGAFAEARLDLNLSGGVLPFAVGPGGAGTSQACFKANSTSNLDIAPCSSGVEGNYGKLGILTYGNSTMGTVELCTGSNAQRMSTNIMLGADHPMEKTGVSPGIVNDSTNCPVISNPVDELVTEPGNAVGALEDGFFNGIAALPWEGRLTCKDGDAAENPAQGFVSSDCVNINTWMPESIDNTPLWDFIVPGANAEVVGGACAPGGGAIKNREEMETCLDAWKAWPVAHTLSLFDLALTTNPRYGAVPILNSDPGGGIGSYLITDFRPTYLHTLYFKCNANNCDTVYSPGEHTDASPPPLATCPNPVLPTHSNCGWPLTQKKSLTAISAFVLTLDMLDPVTAATFPFTPGTIVYNLSK